MRSSWKMADGGRGNDRGEREEKEAEEGERFFVFPSSNKIGPCLAFQLH